MRNYWKPLVILLLALLPITIPLYTESILGSADNLAHLFRVVNIRYAVDQGYVWPRWAALEGHGLGAPIFNFNYAFPYHLINGLWSVFGSLIHASQMYMIMSIILGALGMYWFIHKLWGQQAGIVAAIAYSYMPYHLMTVYIYAGYGEALAFGLFPYLAHALYELVLHPIRGWAQWSATTVFSLLMLSHNLSAIFAAIVFGSWYIALMFSVKKRLEIAKRGLEVFIGSLLLTAFFWLPSVVESSQVRLSILFEKETALRGYFFGLIEPIFKHSLEALAFHKPGYYSYAIGIPTLIVVGVSIVLFVRTKKHSLPKLTAWIFFLWFLLSLFLTRVQSEPIWGLLPKTVNFLSYPYRFFFINTFAVSILTGFVINRLSNNKKIFITFLLLLFFIWQGWMYARADIDYFEFREEYFTYPQTAKYAPWTYKNMGYIEFIPRTASADFVYSLDDDHSRVLPKYESEVATITPKVDKAQELTAVIQATQSATVTINTFYFPGWVGYINDSYTIPEVDIHGRMVFHVPQGDSTLRVVFSPTLVRKVATGLSYMAIVIFACFTLWLIKQSGLYLPHILIKKPK